MADNEDSKEPELTPQQRKAIDLLYEAMFFWHGEGIRLIRDLRFALNSQSLGHEAANIAKIWKGVDDRWIDIAAKLAPYQSSKLSSMIIKKDETKRFVIEAPRVIADKQQWLELVAKEQKLLPKTDIVGKMNGHDDTIDEAEYVDVNEY